MKMLFHRELLILSLIALSLQGQTPADVYRSAKGAVVMVEGKGKRGTGFFVSEDGLVVTNYHVISGETAVTVRLASGMELETNEIASWDAEADIAVLQIRGKGFPKLDLGDSSNVSPGDQILVISNPLGFERSISDGLVSGIRDIAGSKLLQISAPVSPGSSGAPVLDLRGHVVGVAVATMEGGQNLNLAIPANVVNRVMKNSRLSTLSQIPKERRRIDAPALDLQRLGRYVANEMWSEAHAMLQEAVTTNEFNGDLRFALGTVLLKAGQYDEAATQLTLSRKLEQHMWQAQEELASARLLEWVTSGNVDHRTEACTLYRTISELPPGAPESESPLVSLLAVQPDDPRAAQQRAREKLKSLNSIKGTWRDRSNSYEVKQWDSGWSFAEVAKGTKRDPSSLTDLKLAQSNDAGGTGQGSASVGGCLMTVSVEFKLTECASAMVVSEWPTGQAVWIGDSDSFNEIKSKTSGCRYAASLAHKELHGPIRELHLTRVK